MTGWIGEVALYSMVLPLSRVQAHYLAGRLGVAAPSNGYGATVLNDSPLGYWRLGESNGTLAFDQSRYGRNGTYSEGVSFGPASALTTDSTYSTSVARGNGI